MKAKRHDMISKLIVSENNRLSSGNATMSSLIKSLRAIDDTGLKDLASAHGRWRLSNRATLGSDTLEVYERTRCSQA